MGKTGNLGNGFTVMDWMTRRLGLTPKATYLFAAFYDASMEGRRIVCFTIREAAELCKCSEVSVRQGVRMMEEIGLVRNVSKSSPYWRLEINNETLRRFHLGRYEENGNGRKLLRKQES